MNRIDIYSISDRYISFLKKDDRLKNVFDNKDNARSHTRKYLGVVFSHDDFNYYIPFSSPKSSDYMITSSGSREIRKSIIPIIRMTATNTLTHTKELKGTLKLSNMIPVPKSELIPYIIESEQDLKYKDLVQKEYAFIKSNTSMILKNANVLYNQKTRADTLFSDRPAPKYLNSVVDFSYAETKCREFMLLFPGK